LALYSQKDTTRRYVTALLVDLGTGNFHDPSSPSQQELQQFVNGSSLLNLNIEGFKKNYGGSLSGNTFFGMTGFKIFMHESHNTESFAGMRYGQAVLALTSYNNKQVDTLSTFSDAGQTFFVVNSQEQWVSYGVIADRIYFPFGISVFTSQRRVIWASASMEFCPFLNFSYRYEGIFELIQRQEIVGTTTISHPSFNPDPHFFSVSEKKNISGYSAGGYFSTPVSLYIHPFNKTKGVAARFHLFFTVVPLYIFSSSQFGKPVSAVSIGANFGLRYNFR